MKARIGLSERLLVWYARRFPIDRGKLRVVNALWRFLCKEERGRYSRESQLTCGFVMKCDLSEMLQRQLYFFGDYFVERVLLSKWGELSQEASIVFDVGANVGVYSLTSLSANPHCNVHAFEPTSEIATQLEETASANGLGTLNVHRLALAEEPGTLALVRYSGESGDNGGMNFVRNIDPASGSNDEIQADTVDRICESNQIDQIDLMKVDVQGHEPKVLRGALGLLERKAIKWVLLELNWDDEGGGSAKECLEILNDCGYQFVVPGDIKKRPFGNWLRDHDDILAVVS